MQEEPVPPGPHEGSLPVAPAGQAAAPPAPVGPVPVPATAGGGPLDPVVLGAGDGDEVEPFDAEAYFDPYSGPPEGEDAWLGRVASPVADEWLAARQRPAGAREVLAAGFTHGDREPGGRGFAAGGLLDTMEPGPVLAGFADDAIDGGLSALSDDELAGLMGAGRRLASRAAGMELAAVAELAGRRDAHAAATGDRRQAEHAGDEVAVALTLTCRAADKLLALAVAVHRLPAVGAALAAGRIDLPRAAVYADELAGLADVPAAAIAAVTIGDAAGMTTGELRAVLHRAVLAQDPDAGRKRREKAQKQARVECWAEARGTAALAGRDLPPAGVLAADKNIDAAARQLKKAGAGGTLEQLRARVFLALLTGRPLYTLLPGHDGQDQPAGGGDTQDNPGGSADTQDGDGHSDVGQDGDRPGSRGHRQYRDGDGPGNGNHGQHRDGIGNAGQDADGDSDGDGDGDGGGGTRRPRPDTGPPAGPPGTGGGLPAPAGLAGSVNLTIPLATWLGRSGQPGEAAGHGPLDPDTSRDLAARLAAEPSNHWCLTIVNDSGEAVGHGCARAGPPPRGNDPPSGSDPPSGYGRPRSTGRPGPAANATTWLAAVKVWWLETGTCGHARETLTYQPSTVLRHLVKVRHRTCTFPGCRRSARRCDDDHTVPFDQGGRSCECNLSPLCRRHHAAKQAPGWQLRQPWPGHLVWTLPTGRTRTVTPRLYAA
jgi:hypothetical protein